MKMIELKRHPIIQKLLSFLNLGPKPGDLSEKQIEEIATDISLDEVTEDAKLQRLNTEISKIEPKEPAQKKRWPKSASAADKSAEKSKSEKKEQLHHRIRKRIQHISESAISGLTGAENSARQEAKIKELRKELAEKETPTVKAKGGIQIVYGSPTAAPKNELQTPAEINEMMKKIEVDYFKHRISEDDFRRAMYEYRTRLHLSEIRLKDAEVPPAKNLNIEVIGSPPRQKELKIQSNISSLTLNAPQAQQNIPIQPQQQAPIQFPQNIRSPQPQQPIPIQPQQAMQNYPPKQTPIQPQKKYQFQSTQQPPIQAQQTKVPQQPIPIQPQQAIQNYPPKQTPIQPQKKYPVPQMQQNSAMPQSAEKTPAWGRTNTVPEIKIASALEEKLGGRISDAKLAALEEKISQLLKQKVISPDKVLSDIQQIDSNRIVESFNKLISLIEMEHAAKQDLQDKRIKSSTPIEPVRLKKTDFKVESKDKELEKTEINTNFDKLLSIVREQGKISSKELSKLLGLKENQITDLCKILEDENLVTLNYQPVGGVIIQDIHYRPKNAKGKGDSDEQN